MWNKCQHEHTHRHTQQGHHLKPMLQWWSTCNVDQLSINGSATLCMWAVADFNRTNSLKIYTGSCKDQTFTCRHPHTLPSLWSFQILSPQRTVCCTSVGAPRWPAAQNQATDFHVCTFPYTLWLPRVGTGCKCCDEGLRRFWIVENQTMLSLSLRLWN